MKPIYLLLIILFTSCSVKHQYQLHFVDENNIHLDSVKVNADIYTSKPYESKIESKVPEVNDYLLEFDVRSLKSEDNKIYYSYIYFDVSCPGYFDKHFQLSSYYKTKGLMLEFDTLKKQSSEREINYQIIELTPLKHKFNVSILKQDNFFGYGKYKIISNNKELKEKQIYIKDSSDLIISDSAKPIPEYNNELNKYQYNSKMKLWLFIEGYKPKIVELNNSYDTDPQNYLNSNVDTTLEFRKYIHKYMFNIVDDKFKPLNRVKINYNKEINNGIGDFEDITNDNMFQIQVNPKFKEWSDSELISPTKLYVKFSKFGYETLDTIIESNINDEFNNNGMFNITVSLKKEPKESIKSFKWNKSYKNLHFEYVPEYSLFVSSIDKLMSYFDPNEEKIDEIYLFETIKNDYGNEIFRLYRDKHSEEITKDFILEVVGLYPEYKDSLSNHISNYLLSNDSTNNVSRELVLAYYNSFKDEPLSLYYLSLMSEITPIHFFEGVITDYFVEDLNVISEYWENFRIKLLREANSKTNNNKHIKAKLAELLLKKELYDELIPIISSLIDYYPEYSYTYYFKSKIYSHKELYSYFIDKSNEMFFNNFNLTSDLLIKALETSNNIYLDIDIYTVFTELAEFSFENNRAEVVIDVYDKHKEKLEKSFNLTDLYILLTSSYYFLEDYNKAIFYANEIIKNDKNNLFGYLSLGDIERAKKNFKNAIKFYDKAYSIDPNNYTTVYNKIISLNYLNECKKLNTLFDEIDYTMFTIDESNSIYELKEVIDRKCNPEKFVTGYVKTYYYCPEKYGYDESCVYKFDIELTNESHKNIKKVFIEIEITHNDKTYYKHRGWLDVELIPDSVLEYPVKLKNKVRIWNVHASDFRNHIRILDVK